MSRRLAKKNRPFDIDKLLASTQSVIIKESAKSRMMLLNTLKAAPGQENRAMITHFLMVQKWITHPQTPDDWPVSKMPRNDMELMKLATDIDEFQQRQQREARKGEYKSEWIEQREQPEIVL